MTIDTLAKTHMWFLLAVPEPQDKNIHTQLGCHLEEVGEMLEKVSTHDEETARLLGHALGSLDALANHLKASEGIIHIDQSDRAEYLDALCDQIVTATGCARMSKLDILNAMLEVNRSNFSKFSDTGQPIFDPNMKVMKGPDYTKPDLAAFV